MKIKKSHLTFICLFLFGLSFSFSQAGNGEEGIVSIRNESLPADKDSGESHSDPLPEVSERLAVDEVPSLLQGIWQGEDRLVMFSQDKEFALVLRVFYQWYNDRAAEAQSFSELKSRDRNNSTTSPAEDIHIQYITIVENPSHTAGVYELEIKYPGEKEKIHIPVCVIDGKLYMDFLIKDSALLTDLRTEKSQDNSPDSNSSQANKRAGFYRSASSASGITIALPIFKNEVLSYYLGEDGKTFYKIRYWLSQMEYSYEKATFSDGDKVFSVDKYLRIAGKVYQCTTGRSTKIRNIEKSSKFEKNAIYDQDGGIVAFGDEYLAKVPQKKDRQDLLASVEENNKRKHPAPKPLFPRAKIKFHWKEISELEKYNPSTWNKRNLDLHQ